MKRFYGYKHWTFEQTPRCFNVGKGLQGRSHSKHRNHKWHAIVKRYGLRVEVCVGPMTNEEACAWEIEQIALEKTFSTNHSHNDPVDIGCNFTRGGDGGLGYVKSDETCRKISLSKLKENLSPKTLWKRSEALKGKKRSLQIRQKFSEVQKKHHAEHPDTEETRRRKSDAVKRQWQDPEVRRKHSEAAKGRVIPEDVRCNMRKSHRCSICGVSGHKRSTCSVKAL